MPMRFMRGVLAIAISLTVSILLFSGCNEATMLGQDLRPGTGYSQAMETDTFSIFTHTFPETEDSIPANLTAVMSAGAITTDPVFGKTTAITYMQLGLIKAGFSFASSPVLDSVVLSLEYAGYYGDSMSAQQYTVYKVDDQDFVDTTRLYYIDQKFDLEENDPLGTATASPYGLKDSVAIYGDNEAPQLRIKLSNTFGNALLQQKEDGAFTNDSTFHTWLKGFAVVPDTISADRKSLILFNLNSAYTGITVYYHNNTEDSLRAFFPFNPETGAWSNYIHRNYTGSAAEQHFKDSSASKSDSLIYLQSKPGLYANIEIPYLQDFPNALINKAELIITQVLDPAANVYAAPPELFLWKYAKPSKDTLGYLIDAGVVISRIYGIQYTNLSYFGGFKEMTTNEHGEKVAQYRFNITRYLQHLISPLPSYDETKNHGFRLGILNPQSSIRDMGRVVLGGGNNNTTSMKLHVIYTKIE